MQSVHIIKDIPKICCTYFNKGFFTFVIISNWGILKINLNNINHDEIFFII